MSDDIFTVYICHDKREEEAWNICRSSMARRSSHPLHVVKLTEEALRVNNWYDRPFKTVKGQRIDTRDGKPFSTDFSFTRFFVPALQLYQGWALSCDCDFLWTADIAGIFELADMRCAVQVVKHDYAVTDKTKMNGQIQSKYFRKNWSSLILWNCAHPANRGITPDKINKNTGQWLHAFSWLKDEEIGSLPETWNWLSGVSKPLHASDIPCGIHFTLGTPNMDGHEEAPYSDLWLRERDSRRKLNGPTLTEWERAFHG